MNFETLSNEELLSGLRALIGQGHVVLAHLLAYLGEVEDRRLDLESACSSLWDFCVRRLGMGDDEACRRVAAARLVRKFPIALGMIERGEIHMTGLLLLRDHLTEDNYAELLPAAAHKTKSDIQHLIAERFPRPDAPSLMQPLPLSPSLQSVVPSAVAPMPAPESRAPRIEPLSPERYKVQFTANAELKRKIERAADLMRHKNPKGDLSVLMERALDLLITELEKQRLGKTKTRRPSKAPRKKTRPGYVPRSVRREVFERDGEQCTFVDETGRRCESRTLLELDHRKARALGGSDDADNLTVRCRRHNGLSAERDFGRDHIERKKAEKKSPCKNHPRQRRGDDEVPLRALCGMGFKEGEVRRALEIVAERWEDGTTPPIETLLRETLSVLA